MRKKIYVAHTGGTIGMQQRGDGWGTVPGALAEELENAPIFNRADVPEFELEEFDPLLDSAEMVPADWLRIAQRIHTKIQDFDGVVVLHGTDTMAYTASALAFMLENLRKPVVLTGSQVPLCRLRNDAWRNLLTSMLVAANCDIPEVCVFFDDRLYRGCRVRKVDCDSFTAFGSPNYPVLAEAGVTIDVHWKHVRVAPLFEQQAALHETMDPYVASLWLFPGITAEIVRNFLLAPLKGAVIQSYGLGNGPVSDSGVMAALREASERGVVLVNCTQCVAGRVSGDDYATGMGQSGIVSGHDMTPEAALTKLSYLFGRGHDATRVRELMVQDLRGELSLS